MNDRFLPFAVPCLGEEEIAEVTDTLRSGWLTSGPKVRQFETDFARFITVPYALAVNSCTAGLHLALEAIGIGEGDQIITSPYTFTATAEVMRYLGADPLFVDIDPLTCNLCPRQVQQALQHTTHPVKAILPVHFAGQACDMVPLLALAKQYGLKIVEDAAHALPATYRGRNIGTLGDIAVYSFYATKTVAVGEGGMIVTANEKYAVRMRQMRLHGISHDIFDRHHSHHPAWYYEVIAPGYKYNMPDTAAAIGIHQLRKAEKMRQRRAAIAARYTHGLQNLPLTLPQLQYADNLHAWHLYVIQLVLTDLRIDRNRFIELMSEAGIGTSVHFIPLHLQPYWRDRYGFQPQDFPIALDIYQRAVSLPIYPAMRDVDVDRVITTVKQILINAAH